MPMSPDEIKKELKNRNLSLRAIGRRMRPQVSHVSVKRSIEQIPGQTSRRIQRAVARAIGKEESEVFGTAA